MVFAERRYPTSRFWNNITARERKPTIWQPAYMHAKPTYRAGTGPIEAALQAALSLGAPRPADVSLDSNRARRELGFAPRPLDAMIRDGRPEATPA